MFTQQVDNLDKLLDELEDLARSDLPSSRFFVALVERLQLTLAAQSSVLLLPLAGGDWLPIASSGTPSAMVHAEFARRVTEASGDDPEVLMGSCDGQHWLATPIRPRNFSKGCLLTCTATAIPPNSVAGIVELLTAFSEVVAIRQQSELESFLDNTWDKAQALCLQIHSAKTYDEAASWLAGELAQVLGAARVTVMSVGPLGHPQVQAVSGIPRANSRSTTLRALQTVGEEIIRGGKPVLRQQPFLRGADGQALPEITADGSFANLIGVRLSASDTHVEKTRQAYGTLLVIEYQTYPEMVHCATKLPHLLPTIAVAWDQHTRWLRLPRAARLLAMGPLPALRATSPLLKWAALLGILLITVWGVRKPYPLVVEAEGAYEPVTSRAIYASDDGFVEELLVDDGTIVSPGEPLVQLRSPALELRIEQTEGAARAVEEEASGIRIAINQLATESPDVLSNQSRLAGKIAELETRKQSLAEQLQLLEQQRSRLLLVAPIEGRVLAKDLRRNLAGRPVRRGESLFSIVDQAGPWHVRVQVADRDVGYLLQHYSPAQMPPRPAATIDSAANSQPPAERLRSEIDFCLASDPDKRFVAHVAWIADHVENRHGVGCTLEVRGTVGPELPVGAHAGAGVHAFFECGQQPWWFVWCRPMVEAAQRRLWFRSQESE